MQEHISPEDALSRVADVLVGVTKVIETNNERLAALTKFIDILDKREENRQQLLENRLDILRDLMRDERHSMREFTAWLQLMAPTFPGFKSEPHAAAPKGIGLPDDPKP